MGMLFKSLLVFNSNFMIKLPYRPLFCGGLIDMLISSYLRAVKSKMLYSWKPLTGLSVRKIGEGIVNSIC